MKALLWIVFLPVMIVWVFVKMFLYELLDIPITNSDFPKEEK